jgi:hypothetical protein
MIGLETVELKQILLTLCFLIRDETVDSKYDGRVMRGTDDEDSKCVHY